MSPPAPLYSCRPGESWDFSLELRKNGPGVRREPKLTCPTPTAGSGEFAFRREDGLFLRDHIEDPILAFVDVEDELADEGLVILFAQGLVALREIVSLLHFEAFQRLDQLRRVLASAKAGFLHAELERVHRLEIRLDIAVGERRGRVDIFEPRHRVVEEFLVRR